MIQSVYGEGWSSIGHGIGYGMVWQIRHGTAWSSTRPWCVDGMMRVEADGGGSREGEVDRRQQNQNRGINHQ